MPGLYGFFLREQVLQERVVEQLARMMAPTRTRGQTRTDSCIDGRFGLNLVCFQNSWKEPVNIPRDGCRVFFDGYLLNRDELVSKLQQEGFDATENWSDQDLATALFAVLGESLVEYIEGSFNICVYNARESYVKLLSNRHGERHLYMVITRDFFAFASEIKSLVALDGVSRRINRLALQDMFNFGYPSGVQTLFSDISLLEPATVWTVGLENAEKRKYWDYRFNNFDVGTTFDDLVEEAGICLDRSVRRYLDRFDPIGVPLSGGLDSRTLLAISSQYRRDLETYHCAWYAREEEIAKELCQEAGGHWNRYDPLHFDQAELVHDGMDIADGDVHCHQFWFLPVIKDISEREQIKLLLDGYLMDVYFGDTFLVLPSKSKYGRAEKKKIINGIWRRCRPIFVKKAFSPEFYREYEEANQASIEAGMADLDEEHISNFIHRFSFANRSNRYSVALPNVQRQYLEYGYPGLDRSLTDLYLRIPPEYKADARFYRSVLQKYYPGFARVPWAKTGRPLNEDKTSFDKMIDRWPLRQLGSVLLLQLSGGRFDISHRADLNRHFRQNAKFRDFYTDVLDNPRTYSRGIIDKRGVETLKKFLHKGWPVFTLVQSLVTVELWYRRFIDE